MATSVTATILFDGVCNLCNGFVQFIIRHDPQGRFRFAALQSETGQALLAAHGQPPTAAQLASPDSVILLEGGQLYSHSAAVLRIARRLGGPWRLAAVGGLLPQRWRDGLYRFVARHRYRWFGRQESCWLPTPELRARFL
ncbi:thiol-disulfide oxidoreductase DCC family protein [Hymenobacter sp. H14-R3]|uniref:thiol-disulfide oxidoreductase DCC family protein n=1 Tax=Hymenobacter sp. H14-R3 TaxID=3046308 RepID=UPI0024B93933|nr:thiol-disulfide oxidoreductase DCC family protein [Hymenobacter sp. H14-R3]MDJ0365213.1 thiol-disulfide oxidoreductase DCC family protein [Hymenobacter sp. H14-R3]